MTKIISSINETHVTRAEDIMTTRLVVVTPKNTFKEAVELLVDNRLTALPVVDKEGKLLGILREKDIISQCKSFDSEMTDFLDRPIVYKTPVRKVGLATPVDRVGAILGAKSYRHLFVIDEEERLKGVISRRDLIRVIYLRLEVRKLGL